VTWQGSSSVEICEAPQVRAIFKNHGGRNRQVCQLSKVPEPDIQPGGSCKMASNFQGKDLSCESVDESTSSAGQICRMRDHTCRDRSGGDPVRPDQACKKKL
jgi:hypothetical protein